MLTISMNSGALALKMPILITDKDERVDMDISVQYPEWENIDNIKQVIRTSVLCALNTTSIPTKATGRDLEISVVLANDDLMQVLNREYREKDKPTNILTFANLDEGDVPAEGVVPLGDIIMSYDTINKECLEQDKFLLDHVKHLTVHGVLHLLGFDHQNDDEATDMETLEIRILEYLGVQNPYTGSVLS